jgi:hypothetical protein
MVRVGTKDGLLTSVTQKKLMISNGYCVSELVTFWQTNAVQGATKAKVGRGGIMYGKRLPGSHILCTGVVGYVVGIMRLLILGVVTNRVYSDVQWFLACT